MANKVQIIFTIAKLGAIILIVSGGVYQMATGRLHLRMEILNLSSNLATGSVLWDLISHFIHNKN
jgi:hypothetical protein